MNMHSAAHPQMYTSLPILYEYQIARYKNDMHVTKFIPACLRRSHPSEEEHGAAEGLLIYRETKYHNIMNKKSQNI